MYRPPRRCLAVVIALALVATACGDDNDAGDGNQAGDEAIVAQVASYDLVAGRTGRFIVGLFSSDRTRTLAFGTVTFGFSPLDGTTNAEATDAGATDAGATDDPGGRSDSDDTSGGSEPIEASFLPIPGQDIDADQPGPRLVSAAEATGVYGAPEVTFDQPGFWEVSVTATLDGTEESASAAFEVLADSDIPTVGDPAPRTTQPLAGDPDVDPRSIDSRAGTDRPIPDPELHDITIADALDAGRPLMVVVSTPTFCVSRFCGPITDSVHQLAQDFADTPMAFVHLEVWQDFQANIVNPAAREWIAPTPDTDGFEPWVFVVDRNGTITHRFDNVATDAELLAAVEDTL